MSSDSIQGTDARDQYYYKLQEASNEDALTADGAKSNPAVSYTSAVTSSTDEDELQVTDLGENIDIDAFEEESEPVYVDTTESEGADVEHLTKEDIISLATRAGAPVEDFYTDESTDEETNIDLKAFKDLISANEELDEIVSKYGYDKIFDAIDTDESGFITQDEVEKLNLSTNSLADLTVEDIEKIAESADLEIDGAGASEESSDLDPALIQKLRDMFAAQNELPTDSSMGMDAASGVAPSGGTTGSGGVSGGGGNYGTSGATGSSGAAQPDKMSMEQLTAEQAEKQKAVDTAQSNLAAVQSGENAEVKAAQADADEKQAAYEEALKNDELVSEELKEEQEQNAKDIKEKEDNIKEKETAVKEAEAKVYNLDNEISIIDSKISALNASLKALPAKTSDNQNKHAEIDSMRQSIESQIKTLEGEKETKEGEKKELEEQIKADNEEIETLQGELKELEAERDRIEKEILDTCSPETKAALEAYQTAREKVPVVKEEQLSKAQGELDTAKAALEEVNNSIKELQEMQIQLKNRVGGEGEDVAKFALALDGLSASEMKSIMQKAGCSFHDGAWCADFATYVTKQVYGNNATPGDYANSCQNTAYCPTIANWAKQNGILTEDSSQVQPGDFILYYREGRYKHIGVVTSVNPDGTVNTIEGNTSDDNGRYTNGVVNTHSNRRGHYVLMHNLA